MINQFKLEIEIIDNNGEYSYFESDYFHFEIDYTQFEIVQSLFEIY